MTRGSFSISSNVPPCDSEKVIERLYGKFDPEKPARQSSESAGAVCDRRLICKKCFKYLRQRHGYQRKENALYLRVSAVLPYNFLMMILSTAAPNKAVIKKDMTRDIRYGILKTVYK